MTKRMPDSRNGADMSNRANSIPNAMNNDSLGSITPIIHRPYGQQEAGDDGNHPAARGHFLHNARLMTGTARRPMK